MKCVLLAAFSLISISTFAADLREVDLSVINSYTISGAQRLGASVKYQTLYGLSSTQEIVPVGYNFCNDFDGSAGNQHIFNFKGHEKIRVRSTDSNQGCSVNNSITCPAGLFLRNGYLECGESKFSLDGVELRGETPAWNIIHAIQYTQEEVRWCKSYCSFSESYTVKYGKHSAKIYFEGESNSNTYAVMNKSSGVILPKAEPYFDAASNTVVTPRPNYRCAFAVPTDAGILCTGQGWQALYPWEK